MYCTLMRIAQKGTVQGGLTEKQQKAVDRKRKQTDAEAPIAHFLYSLYKISRSPGTFHATGR